MGSFKCVSVWNVCLSISYHLSLEHCHVSYLSSCFKLSINAWELNIVPSWSMTVLRNAVICKSTAYCWTCILMYHLQDVEKCWFLYCIQLECKIHWKKVINFLTFLSYMLFVSHAPEMLVTISTSTTTLYWYNVFSSVYSQVHF